MAECGHGRLWCVISVVMLGLTRTWADEVAPIEEATVALIGYAFGKLVAGCVGA
jgi:hypothetical protein